MGHRRGWRPPQRHRPGVGPVVVLPPAVPPVSGPSTRPLPVLRVKRSGFFRWTGWRSIQRRSAAAGPPPIPLSAPVQAHRRNLALAGFFWRRKWRSSRRKRLSIVTPPPGSLAFPARPQRAIAALKAFFWRRKWRPPPRKRPALGVPPPALPAPSFIIGPVRYLAGPRGKGIFRRKWRARASKGTLFPTIPAAPPQQPAPVLRQQRLRTLSMPGVYWRRKWRPRQRRRFVNIIIPPVPQLPAPLKRVKAWLLRRPRARPKRKRFDFIAKPAPVPPVALPPRRQLKRVQNSGHRRPFFPHQRHHLGIGPPPRPIAPPQILKPRWFVIGPTRQMTAVGPLRSMTAVGPSLAPRTAVAPARQYQTTAQARGPLLMAAPRFFQPAIDAGETASVSFDFGPVLDPTVSIINIDHIVCAVTLGGPDPSPQSRIIGNGALVASDATGVASCQVVQLIGGNMIAGTTYLIQVFVNTTDGALIDIGAHINCVMPV